MKNTTIDLRKMYAPGETVPGMNLNYSGWTGNRLKLTGKDFEIIGHSMASTVIDGGAGAIASLMIGDDSGVITIRDCTIICAQTYGIWYQHKRGDWGPDGYYEIRSELFPNSMLKLRNVRLATRVPDPGRSASTKWAVSTTNVDHDWEDVVIDVPHTAEHALYAHGWAKYGLRWKHVIVDACGAEILKVATRPWEAHFAPNAGMVVKDCQLEGWAQRNWGGGIVLQGPGLQTVDLERVTLHGGDRQQAACLRFDDGLSTIQSAENNQRRYYDVNGVEAGPGACIGTVTMRHVLFEGTNRETMRAGTIFPGYEAMGIPRHEIIGALKMTECGAYGENSKISLSDVGVEVIRGNNLESIEAFADSIGVWTEHEATLRGEPLSEVGR